jgi:hypothetical protein
MGPRIGLPIICLTSGFVSIALRQKAPDAVNLGQPFSLKTALLFASTVSAGMLLAAAFNNGWAKNA